MKQRVSLLVLAGSAAVAVLSWAQQTQAPSQQTPQTGGSTSTTSPTTSPGVTTIPSTGTRGTTRTQQPTWETQQQDQFPNMDTRRPIFLSGKVVLDDGTPPTEQVVIERVCNGVVRPEAYTDSKGRFSFQLGQNTGLFADASTSSQGGMDGFGTTSRSSRGAYPGVPGGVTERELMGCELRANLAGYRSEVVNLAGRRIMDNPDVGTIILKRMGNVEGRTISATTAMAPKDARKAFDKARDQIKKQKWLEAQKELERAVGIYPKYAAAWHQLGMIQEKQNDVEGARKSYAEALAADTKFINPYLQLALISAREAKWQEVADTTDRVVKLNPFDFPQAFFYNAVAKFNLHKLDDAESSAREALKLDTNHQIAKTSHLLGIILAQKQDYKGAAEHMENYLKFAPDAKDAAQVRKQLDELRGFAAANAPRQP